VGTASHVSGAAMNDVLSAEMRILVKINVVTVKKGLLMSEELEIGCARPTGGPVGESVKMNETLRQVQAFQLVRDSKGKEATPSGWRPGKVTLKPGPDLVGKVWEAWKTEMAFD